MNPGVKVFLLFAQFMVVAQILGRGLDSGRLVFYRMQENPSR
jgi:hypothetical protein